MAIAIQILRCRCGRLDSSPFVSHASRTLVLESRGSHEHHRSFAIARGRLHRRKLHSRRSATRRKARTMSKRLDALERRVSQRSSSIGVFLSRSTRRKWLPPRDDDRMALAGAPLQHGRGRSMSHRVRRYGGRARRAATPLRMSNRTSTSKAQCAGATEQSRTTPSENPDPAWRRVAQMAQGHS